MNFGHLTISSAYSRTIESLEFPRVLVQRVVLSDIFHHRMFALLSCELQRGDFGDGIEREDQSLPDVLGVIPGQHVKLPFPSKFHDKDLILLFKPKVEILRGWLNMFYLPYVEVVTG